MSTNGTYLGWHFLRSDRKLRYEDSREVKAGEPLTVDVEPDLCQRGLHASERLKDALWYAPGWVCCRVVLSGDVVTGNDKMVGKSRTVLWMIDAKDVILRWALDCAKSVRHLTDDPRVTECIELTEKYLNGEEVSKKDLRDSADAAVDAAYATAAYAAQTAARVADADAAYAAAPAASWAAAAYAASDATAAVDYEAAYEERLTGLEADLEQRIIQKAKKEGVWVEDPWTETTT